MAGALKLRALVAFYRAGPDGRFLLVQPGEAFSCSLAEGVDLMSWGRATPADAASAARFTFERPTWGRLETR